MISELKLFRSDCFLPSHQKMSKFEDYEKVSKVYDKERVASGADVIAGLLHVYGKRPLRVSDSNSV